MSLQPQPSDHRTRAALWVRVSQPSENVSNQILALQEFAAHRGLEVVNIYNVEASAYHGAHRAFFEQVYQDAHAGQWNVLIVWALDRLSREGAAAVIGVVERLEASGARVLSHQESWLDAGGPARELLLSIFGWVAKQESIRLSERIKAGLDRRRAAGLPVGRQPGARDKARRKRSGQVARRERERKVGEGRSYTYQEPPLNLPPTPKPVTTTRKPEVRH